MASQIEIVNNALALVGDSFIISLDDDTVRARLAKQFYQPTVDAVLRAHPWNCAVTRAQLGLLATQPLFGWKNQFELPADPYCLRVLRLNDDEFRGDGGDDFKIERRMLLTNVTTANIHYIARITDPNEYDVLLYEAISARLAAKLVYPVTGDDEKVASLWKLYQGFIQEARTVDGQEGTPDRVSIGTLTDIR